MLIFCYVRISTSELQRRGAELPSNLNSRSVVGAALEEIHERITEKPKAQDAAWEVALQHIDDRFPFSSLGLKLNEHKYKYQY